MQSSSLILEYVDSRFQIRDSEQPKIKPLSVDFLSNDFLRRFKEPKGGQLLFRAVNADSVEKIFDATAGLGGDSILLAGWGFEVTSCERSEVIFTLLADGLKRLGESSDAKLKSICERVHLINEDSARHLNSHKSEYDVVYLDPMFPDLKGTALPKKEMQLLRKLFVGVDPISETNFLLDAALKSAKKRVVLKRPPAAPKVLNPAHSLEGKAVRFDIYNVKN